MPTPQNNLFTSYNLSEEEQLASYQLTTLTKMMLQNELSLAAQEKLALKFDPLNPINFAQREAELAGKIGILQYILAQSESTQFTE